MIEIYTYAHETVVERNPENTGRDAAVGIERRFHGVVDDGLHVLAAAFALVIILLQSRHAKTRASRRKLAERHRHGQTHHGTPPDHGHQLRSCCHDR